jgi:hypothetical protein
MGLLRIATDGVAEWLVVVASGIHVIAIEKEEDRASAESRRLQRRAARKAKRSNKLKRRAVRHDPVLCGAPQ